MKTWTGQLLHRSFIADTLREHFGELQSCLDLGTDFDVSKLAPYYTSSHFGSVVYVGFPLNPWFDQSSFHHDSAEAVTYEDDRTLE
jgi:hypothetical protein